MDTSQWSIELSTVLVNGTERTLTPLLNTHRAPHLDELYSIVRTWMLGAHTLDIDGIRSGEPTPFKMISQGEQTLEQARYFHKTLGHMYVGVGGVDNDEHPDDQDAESAVGMEFEGMTPEQFRNRFDEYMTASGVVAESLDALYERYVAEMDYASYKDASYDARMLGASWIFKWLGSTVNKQFDSETGIAEPDAYTEVHLRDAVKMARQLLIGQMFAQHEPEPVVDKSVESLICEVIRDFRGIWWHKEWYEGITLTGIIDDIKKSSGNKKSMLVRTISDLRSVLYSNWNPADYGNVDHWMVMKHLVTHPDSQMPYKSTWVAEQSKHSLEDWRQRLTTYASSNLYSEKDRKKATNFLKILHEMIRDREKEEKARRHVGGNPAMDERSYMCPDNFHNIVKTLLTLDGMSEVKTAFSITESAYDFVMVTLRAWYMHRLMSYRAESEVGTVPVVEIFPNWNTSVMGRTVPTLQILHSVNPRAVSMSRKNQLARTEGGRPVECGVDMQINFTPSRFDKYEYATYMGCDQIKLGDDHVDQIVRMTAVCVRVLEYRLRDLQVPDDYFTEFSTTGMCEDGSWYLAVKKWAFGLFNGTDHHPDVPTTEIAQEVITVIVQIVAAISWIHKDDADMATEIYYHLAEILENCDMDDLFGDLLTFQSKIQSQTTCTQDGKLLYEKEP